MDAKAIKERERSYFAKHYLNFLDLNRSTLQNFLNRQSLISFDKPLKYIPDNIIKGKVILDACCNDGRSFNLFRQSGARMSIGCDIDMESMIRGISRKKIPVYKSIVEISPRNYVQGDCESMPFKSGSFDTIFCLRSFHHLPRKEIFIRECGRMLRNGGRLVISDPNGAHPLRNLANKIGKKVGLLSKDERAIKPATAIQLLRTNGFNVISLNRLNVISVINLFIAEIIGKKNAILSTIVKFFLLISNPIDWLLERTLLKVFPSLAWEYLIIAKKRDR